MKFFSIFGALVAASVVGLAVAIPTPVEYSETPVDKRATMWYGCDIEAMDDPASVRTCKPG